MFKEKFDYTNVLIMINVKKGSEIKAAEILEKYSYIYNYSFNDNASEYIISEDNNRTVKACSLGVLIFVTMINLCSIYYINELKFIRRKKNISILKTIGHSNIKILSYIALENLVKCVVIAVSSSFVVTILVRNILPRYTQTIIETNGVAFILLSFSFLLIIQMISLISTFVKICNRK